MAAAVSADGRYIAHVMDEEGQQALWVRQLATTSSVRIIAPSDVEYWGLTFSPDGSYIYYVTWEPNTPGAQLFRVATVGGSPERLPQVAQIATPVAFSPDGRQIAYLRGHSGRQETQLVVAVRIPGRSTSCRLTEGKRFGPSPSP